MAPSVSQRLDGIPRKQLAMRGETLLKKLEVDEESRRLVGRVVKRAIEHAAITAKAASIRMGLSDDGVQVSRWCAGTEPPSLVRLLAVPELRDGLSIALAELNERAEVRTVISLPKRVSA